MQSITVNGVNIRIHGNADVSVDSFGNVSIYVREKFIPCNNVNKPNYFWNKPKKHWLP